MFWVFGMAADERRALESRLYVAEELERLRASDRRKAGT
jgi:hypothetical protein